MSLTSSNKKILCLCGGVGGAKLAFGFSQILPAKQLSIVVNTGDDFEHLGFHISPDIDTVIYTMAGINNKQQGWGIEGESWEFMAELKKSNNTDDWFQLGDKDIRTHKLRKYHLDNGLTLSECAEQLSKSYGVTYPVIPMSDEPVGTMVKTTEGELAFQHYFVREQCRPAVSGFYFNGIETAKPSKAFVEALDDEKLGAVVICPSNPFVSIDPILLLPGIKEALRQFNIPIIAVSPIIGGQAIKGPAAKMMAELNIPCSSQAIAEHYQGLISHLIIDTQDSDEKSNIEKSSIVCEVTQTLMKTDDDKKKLAEFILELL